METVEIHSTSRQTAVCSDILLREGPTVRLIFRPQLVDNPNDPDACVKGRFVYQRKGKNDEWEDADSPSLASLKRGEYFELEIKSGELLPLLRQLGALWRFHRKQGMPRGRVELVRIGQHLAKLLELSEPELDAFLSENTSDAMETLRRVLRWMANNPGTAEQLAAKERQLPELNALVGLANLRAVLQMWSDNAENDDEEFWQGVFATHSYVLSQLFAYPVAIIKGKAYVGGKRYDNLHGNLVDFLGHAPSSGSAILIEIKTPKTPLLGSAYVSPDEAAIERVWNLTREGNPFGARYKAAPTDALLVARVRHEQREIARFSATRRNPSPERDSGAAGRHLGRRGAISSQGCKIT
ncbi:MAG: DUF4263 domain-containing protein [Betaproteobacteria bacterium]